jgi:sugar lactone lactonase YvrE
MAVVTTPDRAYRLYPTGPGSARTLAWPALADVRGIRLAQDGQSLFVCGNEANRPPRCYRSSLEGGDVTPVTPDSVTIIRPDGAGLFADGDGRRWLYPAGGGPRREIAKPTTQVIRWSPDGSALWVFRTGARGHRGVDRMDLATGRRTPLFDLEELPDLDMQAPISVSVADDGRSYVYNVWQYSSQLFTVTGVR